MVLKFFVTYEVLIEINASERSRIFALIITLIFIKTFGKIDVFFPLKLCPINRTNKKAPVFTRGLLCFLNLTFNVASTILYTTPATARAFGVNLELKIALTLGV